MTTLTFKDELIDDAVSEWKLLHPYERVPTKTSIIERIIIDFVKNNKKSE